MFELYKNAAATVPSASTDRVRLFVDTDGLPKIKNSAGTVTSLKGDPGEGIAVGGTTGQVLAKASATNYDTTWVNPTGAVDSVNGQTGVVVLDAADVGAEPADATILKDADIGVTVQGYSAVLAGTTASFTTADETKLDGIAAGAEVNVNADWNAVSGDAQILNKPTLYSDASVDTHLNTGTATTGEVLSWNGTDYDWVTPSSGSVTSVTGTSPVVSSGGTTPAISLASGYGDTQNPYASKTANNFLAAPNGSAGVPTFRALAAADVPTLNQNTTGTASNVTGTVAFANGGTGETTRQAAIDALAGAVTSGQYLRGNGTDVVMSAIQAADVPTLNQNTTGTAANVTGIVAVANGGSGTATPSLVAGTNVTITGSWPNQTIAASSGGGGSALTISNKTAAYTVVAGDLGTIINCTSGTFTVSLTAAATLGSGFNCWIWNTSATRTHVITIDPSGAETIDRTSTLILRCGEGMQIVCDGTNWQTGDKKVMRGYADNITPTETRPVASGEIAVAIGAGAIASSGNTVAIGYYATASNTSAIGIGSGVSATSGYSSAIGLNSGSGGSQAVTGSGAMALGGSYASGTDSFAAAIANNTSSYGAKGANSIAIGQTALASGTNTVAIGRNAVASGTYAVAISTDADGATASGLRSVAIGGSFVTAAGDRSVALGSYADAATKGKLAFSSVHVTGSDATTDAQYGLFTLATATTDATPKALSTDAGTAGSVNQVILPNNSAYAFTGTAVAKQSGSTNAASWKVEGMVVRGANAASTTLVVSTVTAISNVPGWTLALSADTTNGGLAITATGAAATNIKWVTTLQTSEVTYA